MRSLIVGFVILLAGCNQGTNNIPYSDPALVAKVDNLSKALAAATHLQAEQALSIGKLQLIGKVHGQVNATGITISDFGPCADMGIYSGQGGSDSSNPLASQFEIYKHSATANCPGSTTSFNETTGLHDRLKFAAWDGPNCTGTMYVETDIPQNSMSLEAMENILVIMSPDPSDNTVYATQAGSIPEPIQIQSSFNASGGLCGTDVETRMVIGFVKNDPHVTGYPDSLVPGSWSRVSP